jgi:hypothetical protein
VKKWKKSAPAALLPRTSAGKTGLFSIKRKIFSKKIGGLKKLFYLCSPKTSNLLSRRKNNVALEDI